MTSLYSELDALINKHFNLTMRYYGAFLISLTKQQHKVQNLIYVRKYKRKRNRQTFVGDHRHQIEVTLILFVYCLFWVEKLEMSHILQSGCC